MFLTLASVSLIITGMKKLHDTQVKLLELLADHVENPLTVRELQEALGVSSTSIIAHHIAQLEKKGYLKRDPYNPQNYQVLSSPERSVSYLNLYGLAQCGPGGSVLEGSPIDRIAISSKILGYPAEQAFMVKARGKSMEPQIHEGDLVIARKTSVIEEGRPMVCVNDGEALIKVPLRDRNNPSTIILQSYNSHYPAFVASGDFRVEGVVTGSINSRM